MNTQYAHGNLVDRLARRALALLTLCAFLLTFAAGPARAQDATDQAEPAKKTEASEPEQAQRFAKFQKQMSGVRLTGQFTITGKDDKPPAKEEYEIRSVSKLPQGDLWLFSARVKYGQRDVVVPMPLPVKWADDTPVISLTDVTIPGLGTFSARVVIDDEKYAGTWKHGAVGGHLFGTIQQIADEDNDSEQ